MENRYKNFTDLVLSISRCIQKIKCAEMENMGFKGSQVQSLFVLYCKKGGATLTELASECLEDKAATSRTVKELLESGLVFVDEKEKQKYKNKIKLTSKGEKVGKIVSEKIDAIMQQGSTGISAKERENLYKCLFQIFGNLNKICEDLRGEQHD